MKLYNTLTRKKEELSINDNTVRMYACGPTVYNYIHIGNARCFVIFDFLRRYLEYRGHKVIFVQNFTDVDDKMIKKARAEGKTVKEIADRYIKEYFTDAEGLGVKPATYHPRATETIPEIIDFVKTLVDNGSAYEVNGNVYFSAKNSKTYGCLSHYNLEELEAGARIDVNDEKRDPFDFALWKAKKEPDEISWPSPWGEGRPGWHIECSAMVKKYLGTEIDIHAGGQDLVFPHHENEIAQTECATGKPLAKFWVHNGYINTDNKKMSKSTGLCFWVREAAKIYGYPAVRFFLLSGHYRTPVNCSPEILQQSAAAYERINNCRENLEFRINAKAPESDGKDYTKEIETIFARKQDIFDALDDDFHTANALAALFEITRDINAMLNNEDLSKATLKKIYDFYADLLNFFGFMPQSADSDKGEDEKINELVAQRTAAKKEKNYARADEIRKELSDMGITLEDTPQGTKWKRA